MKSVRSTKIVATLGPATNTPEMIEKLLRAGVNVFRLNFSHGEPAVHRTTVEAIRSTADRLEMAVCILQDLQGPKIRVTHFKNGKVTLEAGEQFTLTCGDDSPGDATRVGVTYTNLCGDLKADDKLLLDDGRLELRVTYVDGPNIKTLVVVGGELSNNKGINIPGAHLSLPALTDKDVQDLRFGAELDVDWVAMSFVRTRDDLLLARHYLARAGSQAKLMAKIEKPSAVDRFAEILEEVDGVMVARGDLGVEMAAERVPLIQKHLISECMQAGKPVITATQMLESMITNPSPTRAEASDVANAIFDGTDAVMLSAETAVGAYPVEAVRMMDRIARVVENSPEYRNAMRQLVPTADTSTADGVALAAVEIAYNLDAQLIVTFTTSGSTAMRVSRNRPPTPVLAITPNPRALRQMMVAWGVVPYLSDDIHDTDEMVSVAKRAIEATGLMELESRYVITAGVPFGMRGSTNLIRVERYR